MKEQLLRLFNVTLNILICLALIQALWQNKLSIRVNFGEPAVKHLQVNDQLGYVDETVYLEPRQ